MKHPWYKGFYAGLERAIRLLEVVLSIFLIIGVLGAGVIMVSSLYGMLSAETGQSFQTFLDDALLYLIGLEVAMLLLKRDAYLVVDILTFAIGRKMIVNMQHGIDFLFGALAILVLYLVKAVGSRYGFFPRSFWAKPTGAGQHHAETPKETADSGRPQDDNEQTS